MAGVLLVLVMAACGGAGSATNELATASVAKRYSNLVRHLRERDLAVAELGEVSIPCFIVRPRAAIVSNGTLWVFEYEDAAAANLAIGRISPARFEAAILALERAPLRDLHWQHFYRGEKLLVKYDGLDPEVTQALESALGPQFAGGASGIRC